MHKPFQPLCTAAPIEPDQVFKNLKKQAAEDYAVLVKFIADGREPFISDIARILIPAERSMDGLRFDVAAELERRKGTS